MIFLMVINSMLYFKLRRIEALADNIRSDPSLMLRMSHPDAVAATVGGDGGDKTSVQGRENYLKELYNWRTLITNTLTALEKVFSFCCF